ncbi:phosphatase PAP2 family protein [Variovorax rhizosphaerae]|uniref:Phosphatase PAP2 family protein n=1 Tax=Variovorax rhizosphaerae TaxID=1836200 RepID=A0ABU8WSS0_9BURK
MHLLNHQLFLWIGAGHSPNAALLWLAMQVVEVMPWIAAGAVVVAVWLRPTDRHYILAACLMAALASMLARELADVLKQPRPFMIGLSPMWIEHSARGSMPSTHASVMFTVALCFLYRPRLRAIGWILAGLALLTGWARVYVGVHFPLDVAVGALLGSVLAAAPALASRWRQHIQPTRPSPPPEARPAEALLDHQFDAPVRGPTPPALVRYQG